MKHSHLKQNAVQLLQKQQFSRALDECSKYCKKVKSDPEGLMLLGSIYGALKQFDNSIDAFRKAIKLRPDIPQLYFNLSIALYKSGKLEATTDNLKKAIKLAPDYADAHVNLGMAYSDRKMYEQAEQSFKDAINIKPDNANAFFQLGILLYSKNNLPDARKFLEKAIESDPNLALAHYNLGILLNGTGEPDTAIKLFERTIELTPEYVNAYQALATGLLSLGAIDKAADALLNALKFDPQHSAFYYDLASILGRQGRHAEAIKYHEKAVELSPDNAGVHLGLAQGLVTINRYDEALVIFEKAAQLAESEYSKQNAIAGIAIIYERRKEYDKAYNLIKPYLNTDTDSDTVNPEINPKINSRIALVFGNLSKNLNMTDQAIRTMESALNSDNISNDNKTELHFQIGKTCDELRLFDKAFEHYSKGNECFRERGKDLISRYSIKDEKKNFNDIQQFFSKNFFSGAPNSGCESERPVFVVGMPRSGTTLTESIISSHPMAFGAGEMHDIAEIKRAVEAETGKEYPICMADATQDLLNKLAQHYLSRLNLKNTSAIRIVDKMPHNFLQLGLIALLFPKARIIHIQRHPIDNCLSIYFQRFNIGHTYATDLKQLGQHYRLYADLMHHWNEVLPVPILNIKYDELVLHQEATTRQMINFCDLEWDDQCLLFHTSKRDVATPSYDQVSQPMYNKSSGRWKNYQNHIGLLVKTLDENGATKEFEATNQALTQ